MKLTRRILLRFFARAGLVLGFAPIATDAVARDGLDPAIRRTLASYLDTLIPDDEASPGAVKAGIDKRFASLTEASPQFRKLIVAGCRWLDGEAVKAGTRSFPGLDEDKRNAIIGRASRSARRSVPRQFFDRTRRPAFVLYYGIASSWSAIGYAGPPQPAGFLDYAESPEQRH